LQITGRQHFTKIINRALAINKDENTSVSGSQSASFGGNFLLPFGGLDKDYSHAFSPFFLIIFCSGPKKTQHLEKHNPPKGGINGKIWQNVKL
jgi:hypothetical protein